MLAQIFVSDYSLATNLVFFLVFKHKLQIIAQKLSENYIVELRCEPKFS